MYYHPRPRPKDVPIPRNEWEQMKADIKAIKEMLMERKVGDKPEPAQFKTRKIDTESEL